MIPDTLKDSITTELNKLEGWLTPERGIKMATLILEQQPTTVVEIGVFGGRSLIAQALALEHNGRGRIYGIDSWRVPDCLEGENDANREWWKSIDIESIHRSCMAVIWKLKLEHRAIVIRSASQHCSYLFAPKSIDILFIDGNHSEEASCRDVMDYLPLVKPGGFIWFDDTDWPSTQYAQEIIETNAKVVSDHTHYKLFQRNASVLRQHARPAQVTPV